MHKPWLFLILGTAAHQVRVGVFRTHSQPRCSAELVLVMGLQLVSTSSLQGAATYTYAVVTKFLDWAVTGTAVSGRLFGVYTTHAC